MSQNPIEQRHVFSCDDEWINGVAVSRDGTKIATVAFYGILKLIRLDTDTPTIQSVAKLADHEHFKQIGFTRDGAQLLAASDDGNLYIYDVETCNEVKIIKHGGPYELECFALSPDQRLLFTGGEVVNVFDFTTGKFLHTVQDDDLIAYKVTTIVPTTPDGSRFLHGTSGAKIFYMDTTKARGTILQRYKGNNNTIKALALIGDGKQFVSGAIDHSINLWDLASGVCLRKITAPQLGVWSLVVLPDNETVICGNRLGKTVILNMRQEKPPLAEYAARMIMGADILKETSLPLDAVIM